MPEDSAKSSWWRAPGTQQAALASVAAVPVVLVNGTAFIGQFAFLRQHVPWIFPGQVLVAIAIESIAVYLAWHAHLAAMKNDSSTRLKAGAYSFAQVVGAMNYSHYMAPHWRPTVMAVLMYFMSALSPLLWGVHTRRASRDRLMERALVEEHAVRLGGNRWTWHPVRSARVTYWATWHGINEPARAIARFASRYGTADVPAEPRHARKARPAQSAPVTVPAVAAPPAPVPAAPVTVPAEGSAPGGAPASLPWPAPRGQRVLAGTEPWPTAPAETVPAGEDVPAPSWMSDYSPAPAVPRLRRANPLPQGSAWPPAPGDEDVPAVRPAEVQAAAALRAEPSMAPGRDKHPGPEVIGNVELQLAGMQDDGLPSERNVARMLGDPGQRRLAKQLLAQRRQAGARPAGTPAGEAVTGNGAPHQGTAPGMIAPPQGFQPGGTGTHG